eukprot:5484961-Amphidinium_carterae.1
MNCQSRARNAKKKRVGTATNPSARFRGLGCQSDNRKALHTLAKRAKTNCSILFGSVDTSIPQPSHA